MTNKKQLIVNSSYMTLYDEIISDLGLYTRAEKTELAYRLISKEICDSDLLIGELGLTEELNNRKEAAEREVEEECSPDVLISDVSTEKISDYVNKIMKEMQ